MQNQLNTENLEIKNLINFLNKSDNSKLLYIQILKYFTLVNENLYDFFYLFMKNGLIKLLSIKIPYSNDKEKKELKRLKKSKNRIDLINRIIPILKNIIKEWSNKENIYFESFSTNISFSEFLCVFLFGLFKINLIDLSIINEEKVMKITIDQNAYHIINSLKMQN